MNTKPFVLSALTMPVINSPLRSRLADINAGPGDRPVLLKLLFLAALASNPLGNSDPNEVRWLQSPRLSERDQLLCVLGIQEYGGSSQVHISSVHLWQK
jgi:hypothetical protein